MAAIDNTSGPVATPARWRLATYNLHQGGARAAAAHLVAAWQPAVLCLQETRDPTLLATAPGATPPAVIWQSAPGRTWGSGLLVWGGTAAPLPLPPDLAGWIVGAEICNETTPAARPIHAFSIHAPPGEARSYTRTVQRMLDVVGAGAAGRDIILGGDFNVVMGWRQPDEPVRMSRAEAAILTRLEDELGLRACWQAAHPGQPLGRTLRWRHRADSLPYHCDGLFVPVGWLRELQDCTILIGEPWEVASDHHPVVATFG